MIVLNQVKHIIIVNERVRYKKRTILATFRFTTIYSRTLFVYFIDIVLDIFYYSNIYVICRSSGRGYYGTPLC